MLLTILSSVLKNKNNRSIALPASRGFTLLELMIVIVVMGVLAAIALPSMIRHVGKARETEAINNLSAIGFAQQGYFFEFREFATDYNTLGVRLSPKYFDYPSPQSSSSTTGTKSQAIALDTGALTSSRNYAHGTYYVVNTYRIVVCQSPSTAVITQVPDNPDDNCINGVKTSDTY